MNTPPGDYFLELYIVNLDYQKPDGLWVHNYEVEVLISCQHGVNEKNNHDKAASQVQKAYPGCRINHTTYA